MIIDTKIESDDQQVCIINWLPNKDDFWVFGTSMFKDYYVIHEPTLGTIEIVPNELKKKPKLQKDVLPETDILGTFSLTILIIKLLTFIVIGFGVSILTIVVFAGKLWGGLAFLNTEYDYSFSPEEWVWVVWIKSLFGF